MAKLPQVPQGDASWQGTYRGVDPRTLPWHTERLDPDIAAWIDALRLPRGARVLDLGAGAGTATLHCARLGYQVDAVDMSPEALGFARERLGKLAEQARFHEGDVFRVELQGPFDLALDRGLFHVFPDELRAPYAERVAGWLKPRARLLLKTFSDAEPPGWGPRRVSRAEVKAAFGARFDEEAWQPSTFPGTLEREPKAHLFVLRRR